MSLQKLTILISVLLAISLAANYYFYSGSKVDINEEQIRSQERLKQYRATIDTLEAQNSALVAQIDTISAAIDTVETEIINTVTKYETQKANITSLSSGSAVKFLAKRLNKADSLRN